MATATGTHDSPALHTLEGDSAVHSHSSHDAVNEKTERDTPYDSAAASTNNEEKNGSTNDAASDETRSIEMEQSIGVTKIEALYIVFGKGWKLAGLWL